MAENEKYITISVEDLRAALTAFFDEPHVGTFDIFLRNIKDRASKSHAQKQNVERQIKDFQQREELKVD